MAPIPICLLILSVIAVYSARSLAVTIKISIDLILLLTLAVALYLWGTTPLPQHLPPGPASETLRAIAVIWWLIAARAITFLTLLARGHSATSKSASLFSDLLAAAIYVTIAMIVLNSVLGIPVKGLIATSGIVAIVIGLALQNTLSDVFSGIAVGIEQPFHVGDRVSLPDLGEGVLAQINWRTIRILTDGGNIAVIPNSVVAKSLITNFSQPTPVREVSLEVEAPRGASNEIVVGLLRQVALLCPDMLAHPDPSYRLSRMGRRYARYKIDFHVRNTDLMAKTKSRVMQTTYRLFDHGGIGTGLAPTRQALLREMTLFASLSDEQLLRLADCMVDHVLEPECRLFEEGSKGASIFVVRQGVLEMRKRADGGRNMEMIGRIGPGDTVGQVSMLTGEPRPVSVIALTASDVSELPRSALENLIADDHVLASALKHSVQRGRDLIGEDHAEASRPADQGHALIDRLRLFFAGRG